MKLLDMGGKLYQTLNKIVDLIWLNILMLICCIPIFTIGASVTAMYYVAFKMVKNEEGYITKSFFKAFRENFRQATPVWLVMLALLVFFWVDLSVIRSGIMSKSDVNSILEGIIFFGAILIAVIAQYFFPLLARYENSSKELLKNAGCFIIVNIPKTVLMAVLEAIPFFLLTRSDYFLFFYFLIGVTLPTYFCALLLRGMFDEAEEKIKKYRENAEVDGDMESKEV